MLSFLLPRPHSSPPLLPPPPEPPAGSKLLVENGECCVYELETDTDTDTGHTLPRVDVVFFHGSSSSTTPKSAWWSTWTSGDSEEFCWPKWLGPQLNARILFMCYPAFLDVNDDLTSCWFSQARSLLSQLSDSSVELGKDGRPVILVGHGMGGLMMKQLLLDAHIDAARGVHHWLPNVRGMVFFATPHRGFPFSSWTASDLAKIPIFRAVWKKENTDRLAAFNTSITDLTNKFFDLESQLKIIPLCFVEQPSASLDSSPAREAYTDHRAPSQRYPFIL